MVSAHTSCNGREDDRLFSWFLRKLSTSQVTATIEGKKKEKKASCNAPQTCFSRIFHSTRTKEQKVYLKKITIMMPTCPSPFMI